MLSRIATLSGSSRIGPREIKGIEVILDMEEEMVSFVLKLNWTLIDDPPPELEIPRFRQISIRRETKEAALACQTMQEVRTAFPETSAKIRFGYWTTPPKEWRRAHPEKSYAFVPTEYV